MRARSRTPSLAPTSALDHALEALARNDPEACLRHAVPALADVGADAPAADLVGRAAVMLGAMAVARPAFETAARALAVQGMAGHAIAAALAVHRLTGSDTVLTELARVFGADAQRTEASSVRPPPLASVEVSALPDTTPRADLLSQARAGIDALAKGLPATLPVRTRHPLWGSLPPGAFERFARALEVRICPTGEQVITEGEPGQSVFVVARGEVRVVRGAGDDAVELAVLGAESVFGEMALLTDGPRAASARTTRAAVLLEAPREALEEAALEVPAVGDELGAWGRRRLVANLVRMSALLREVPPGARETLVDAFETVRHAAGEVVVAEGDPAPGLYLLATGRVEVRRREADGQDLVVATIGPGGCVGEVSLVLRRPASATVVALVPTVSLVLRPERFLAVVHEHPELLASLYALAVERSEELNTVVAQVAVDADDLVIV